MKQLFQSLRSGETFFDELPIPSNRPNHILIKTVASLVSPGTERMLLNFGKGNLLQKAQQQPDKLSQALEKIQSDGILPTLNSITTKLDSPLPLGYCNVGVVVSVGPGVSGFVPGQRVVSNGPHAEYVSVPQNLCALIPDEVSDDLALFTVLGSISLHAIRVSSISFGETVAVSGLGIIGLLCVHLLRHFGCKVLAYDPSPERCKLAAEAGAEVHVLTNTSSLLSFISASTSSRLVDACLVTASTSSDEPLNTAFTITRAQGKVTLVGVTGMNLKRDLMYKKEITFKVSCAYGPGRYDHQYESGSDYPFPYVRWTLQRNLEAFLYFLSSSHPQLTTYLIHSLPFSEANLKYQSLLLNRDILVFALKYSEPFTPPTCSPPSPSTLSHSTSSNSISRGLPNIALVGTGAFASSTILPSLSRLPCNLHTIFSHSSLNIGSLARKYGFDFSTSDFDSILNNPSIDAVLICTRHDSHANYVSKALAHNKATYVDKPLCLNQSELTTISDLVTETSNLRVGFNRRYSPLIEKLLTLLDVNIPINFSYTINAGPLPPSHWLLDPLIGGGRLIGEGCHFVDLITFLARSNISELKSQSSHLSDQQPFSLLLSLENGSFGTINYFTNGSKREPKEHLTIYSASSVFHLHNFRKLVHISARGRKTYRLFSQDKGHTQCLMSFIESISNSNTSTFDLDSVFKTHSSLFKLL